MNAENIIKELRNCGGGEEGLRIVNAAADMIESLQAQLYQCKEENEAWDNTDCNACPFSDWEACDELCSSKNELLKFAKSLADQLTESQRRERAAVEDIKRMPSVWPCYACKHIGKMSNRCHKHDRECFEWRGLEEGESDE